MDTVRIEGREYPFKKTNRAMRRLEQSGVDMSGTVNQVAFMLALTYECAKEGHLLSKAPGAFMTMDEFEELDASAPESFIDQIVKSITEGEKKHSTSSPVNGDEVLTQSMHQLPIVDAQVKEAPDSVRDRMSKG